MSVKLGAGAELFEVKQQSFGRRQSLESRDSSHTIELYFQDASFG